MIVRKGFKFRLKVPHKSQEKLFQFLGCTRFFWNKAWALQKHRLDKKEKVFSRFELDFWLKLWKKSDEYGFLKEAHSQILQQSLLDLDKAMWDGLTKRKGMPKFKKRSHNNGFRYPQGFKLQGNQVFLPKLGWFTFYKSRKILGTPKNISVSCESGHWYISVQTEQEVKEPKHPSKSIIALDMGITFFAMPSMGYGIRSKNSFKKYQDKLAKEQRKLAKKKKFSNNWNKQKKEIQKVHSKIKNVRNDFLNFHSTRLSKNHAIIVIEDLKIRNISKSAKGDKDSPGRNVKQKSGLNRSILDQGWYRFRKMLEYKQEFRGGRVIAVDPKNTSRKCSSCGHVAKENRQTQSQFFCVLCGHSENADRQAARNILAAGHAVLACGEKSLDFSMKQEPLVALA